MRWFGKKTAVVTLRDKSKPAHKRLKDWSWECNEGHEANIDAIVPQLLQDLRDELKALNKKLDKMDDNFRLVFGVEEEKKDD